MVALVGGVIAFIGDRVGMRAGRKRLTVFGLRPKYTSIIIAILTGVVTASCTLGILSIASENVRLAVFHLTQLRQDLRQTQARNLTLKAEYELVQSDLTKLSKKWQAAQVELDTVNQTLTGLRAKIGPLTQAKERAEQDATTAQNRLVLTAADLTKVQKQYDEVNEELSSTKEEVKFYQQRRDNLEDAIALLENQIDGLKSQKEYLGTGILDYATQTIVIHTGEVLVSTVVPSGRTFAEVETAVMDILNRADRIARERGAAIENKEVGTKVDMKRLTGIYPALTGRDEPVVMRIVASSNTLAGRPAFVYPEILADAEIFHAGATLASLTVEAGSSQDDVLARIVTDLWPQARAEAEAKGMVGPDGGRPPLEMSFQGISEVAAKVAEAKGRIELKLVAARGLRRAGDSLALVLQTS